MALTIADAVVALVVLVSAMLAFNRGLVREALAIGGWVASAFIAFYFAPLAAPLMLEIPYLGDFLRSSCTMTALAGFIAVFAVALIVLSIFTPVLSSAVQATPLAVVDRGLGFVFGAARGVLLVAVVYLLYNLVITDTERLAVIENSASHALISDAARAVQAWAPTSVPDWLQTRIDNLMGACVAQEA
ncbi:CvpA family protein [Pikeienuella sp. HZG-20]|uniref:CvpA family protein n=1 Tax=Paludibacillus litoralis TaxID=3133267 RepID=UPI0030EC501C